MGEAKSFLFERKKGAPLHGIVDFPDGPGRHPVVVICHGFKGFMEWAFFPPLAELLSQRGFLTLRFNFSGSGMIPGEDRVTDLEAFRSNTFSADLEDLLAVLGGLEELSDGRADLSRIGLLGHSRGGGAALLAAAEGDWKERISALVTWAGVGTFERFSEEQAAIWRRDGEWVIVNGRTGQKLPMGLDLLHDMERHAEELNLTAAAARRRAPWLVLHGEVDETVPLAEARLLEAAAVEPREIHVIEGGDHTFGSRHPFRGPSRPLIEVMNLTQAWFRRYL